MQHIIAEIGRSAWNFAQEKARAPQWYKTACTQAHGEAQDFSSGQRVVLGRYIASLPKGPAKEELESAFLTVFDMQGLKLRDALTVLKYVSSYLRPFHYWE